MRRRPQRREREDITELFGDIIQDKAESLFGDDEPEVSAPPARRAEPRAPGAATGAGDGSGDDGPADGARRDGREIDALDGPPPEYAEPAGRGPAAGAPRSRVLVGGRPDDWAPDDWLEPDDPDDADEPRQPDVEERLRRAELKRRAAAGGPPRDGRLIFADDHGLLGQVAIWHGLATILTLGLYRFWMKTEQRRVVWSHTRLDGEPFEYTGSGLELFVGGMIAVVFVSTMLAAVNLSLTFAGFAFFAESAQLGLALAAAIVTLPVVQYAIYRARRYRLNRTRWRGIRFGMSGSGLSVVLLWAVWMPFVVGSAGLLWPFWRVARERYLTNHALWGDEKFRFQGSAFKLLPYWLPIWGVSAALALAAAAALAGPALPPAFYPLAAMAGEAAGAWFAGLDPSEAVVMSVAASVAFAAILVAYFAAETRLFMNSRMIAAVRPICRYGAGDLWAAYGMVLLKSIWPGILVAILIGLIAAVPSVAAYMSERESYGEPGLIDGAPEALFGGYRTWRAQGLMLMSLLLNYILTALWSMWLWLAVWYRTRHARLCAATSFAGLESLDAVRQRVAARQTDAEGFADVMDIGGI